MDLKRILEAIDDYSKCDFGELEIEYGNNDDDTYKLIVIFDKDEKKKIAEALIIQKVDIFGDKGYSIIKAQKYQINKIMNERYIYLDALCGFYNHLNKISEVAAINIDRLGAEIPKGLAEEEGENK